MLDALKRSADSLGLREKDGMALGKTTVSGCTDEGLSLFQAWQISVNVDLFLLLFAPLLKTYSKHFSKQ